MDDKNDNKRYEVMVWRIVAIMVFLSAIYIFLFGFGNQKTIYGFYIFVLAPFIGSIFFLRSNDTPLDKTIKAIGSGLRLGAGIVFLIGIPLFLSLCSGWNVKEVPGILTATK